MSKAFTTVYTALVADDAELLTILRDNWACMDPEEKRLIRVLRGGSGVSAGAAIADNSIVRGDGGASSIQGSGWAIADTDEAAVTVDGVSETGLAVLSTGEDGTAIQAIASGLNGVGLRGANITNAGIGIEGSSSVSGGVAILASANHASAIALQIANFGGFNTNLGTLATAARNVNFPDAAGTVALTNSAINPVSVGATTPGTGAFTTLSASGQILASDGTAAAPSIASSSNPENGIFFPSADITAISVNGGERMRFAGTASTLGSSIVLGWTSGTASSGTVDVALRRLTAQSLALARADSATPLANTLTIGESASVTDTGGGNGIIASGTGRGNGAVSSLIFQTPTVGGAGTGAQTLATRLTLSSANATFAGTVASGNNLTMPSTGSVLWTSNTLMTAPLASKVRIGNTGATTGVTLDASTDGLLNVQNFAGTGGGRIAAAAQSTTLAAAATTLAVTSNVVNLTGDAGANTLATITGGVSGMRLTIIFTDGNVTITDTAAATADTVNLSAALTGAANTVLDLVHNGTKWMEVSRSVNG